MLWIALGFGLIAGTFFLNSAWALWNGKRSLHWPSTKGVIKVSRIEERSRVSSSDDSGLKESSYDALVRYEFTVGERVVSGHRISFMPLGASFEDTKHLAGRYRVGKDVKVYYSPTNPNLCTLERGTTTFAWIVMCAAGVVLVFLLGIPAGFVAFTPSAHATPG